MNRKAFMEQLQNLLWDISPAEREEAIRYYDTYFDDAGPENEGDVIESLGSPEKVAENIKKDIPTFFKSAKLNGGSIRNRVSSQL